MAKRKSTAQRIVYASLAFEDTAAAADSAAHTVQQVAAQGCRAEDGLQDHVVPHSLLRQLQPCLVST